MGLDERAKADQHTQDKAAELAEKAQEEARQGKDSKQQ
jgi:hypothetical protein